MFSGKEDLRRGLGTGFTAPIEYDKSNAFQCGTEAYYDEMYATKTVDSLSAIGDVCRLLVNVLTYYTWCQYFNSIGLDQNNSLAVKRLAYLAFFFGMSWICTYLQLVPYAVTINIHALFTLLMLICNFRVDSEWWRKKKGLGPVTNNVAYLIYSTVWAGTTALFIEYHKKTVLESSGPAAAAMSVSFMGIVFTALFESVTNKATSVGRNGPFMFPFYFGLDLVTASILLTVAAFSQDFFMVVMMQEMMGLFRNCGGYDIGIWLVLTVTRISDAGEFPLKRVTYLEELGTISAVDSVSEVTAMAGFMSLVLGESFSPFVDPSQEGCGIFVACDDDGKPSRSVVSVFSVCLVAISIRAGFFAFERFVFLRVMRNASKIERSQVVMKKSLGSLKLAIQKTTKAVQLTLEPPSGGGVSKSVREKMAIFGFSSSFKVAGVTGSGEGLIRSKHEVEVGLGESDASQESTDKISVPAPPKSSKPKVSPEPEPESSPELHRPGVDISDLSSKKEEIFSQVLTLMESINWRFFFFTKRTNTAIESYHSPRGDDSSAAAIYAGVKGCFIYRSTINLKTSLVVLKTVHLNYLEPSKIKKGGIREIIQDNGDCRILYSREPMPPPFLFRSMVQLEVTKDIVFDDGRKACLICSVPTFHDSKRNDPQVDVRMDQFLFATYFEEIEVGERPVTRVTDLGCGDLQLPYLVNITIGKSGYNKFFANRIDRMVERYEYADTEDDARRKLEEVNEEKLNMANTLKKVFTGSKAYLFVVAASIMYQVVSFRSHELIHLSFEVYWNSTGLCSGRGGGGGGKGGFRLGQGLFLCRVNSC